MLSGKAKLAGVMGWPVGHSRSPRLHGWWLQHYGIDGAYVPLPVAPERLEQALRALPVLGFKGCNLTVPHKESALKVMDRLDMAANRIGAVNTVVVHPDGSLEGRNTDAFGFRESLARGAPGWQAAAGPAVVVGAGGAARAVAVALLDAGVPELRIVNRTRARAEELTRDLCREGLRIRSMPWEWRTRALADAALLVNTTTQGMVGQPALELDLSGLPPAAVVADIVYTPLLTPLLKDARARGHGIVDGIGMLLHQARPGFEAWFGIAPQVTPELRDFVLGGL